MERQQLIKLLKQELKKQIDPVYRDGERRFFKEPIKNFGVRLLNRRKIAAKFWPEVKKLTQTELYNLAEKMFEAGDNEYASIASSWIYRRQAEFKPADFKIFAAWVNKYLDNWAKIDDFCTHSLGYLVNKYPELTKELLKWTKSKNRWVKRAAGSQLIKTAKALLEDQDDMVQKGYGWMLKEASNHNQSEVFGLVMKYKDKMPRTALRYAIEKMPVKLKQEAMK